jgi:hypothetical protein
MNTQFKEFNEKFFSKCKRTIKWFDQEGLFTMSDNRVVRITIDDIGTRDHFNGYMVEIYNNQNGIIIKKFFKFHHYLTMIDRQGSDSYSHVWKYKNEFDWYISQPKDTKEMTDKIFQWIDSFM